MGLGRSFLWAFRPLPRIARSLERITELLELQLRLQGGASAGLFSTQTGEPGGESYHWLPEEEEVAREELKKAYERQFGVTLSASDPVPEEWIEQILLSGRSNEGRD